jgi:GR25 family glycosyltransferase involved in LPS biosynthesis
LAETAGMETVIVDAIDKESLDENQTAKFVAPGLLLPSYPYTLKKGEVACFLSHRKVWKMIAEGADDFALVLEDDVRLENPVFAEQLAFAAKNAGPGDLVRFPRAAGRDKGRIIASGGAMALVEPDIPGPQTCAALVGRIAASRLLAQTSRFDRPVDGFLQLIWTHKVRICAMLPPCIEELGRGTGASLVQSKGTGAFANLWREFARWRYRKAIVNAARRHDRTRA